MPKKKRFRRSKQDRQVQKSKRIPYKGLIVAVVVMLLMTGYLWHRDALQTVEIMVGQYPLREKGLSGRKHLPSGRGMLFIFDFQRNQSFWMKDTSIPLSIAFISAEGEILQIEQMDPGDLDPVTSDRSAKYALEVNKGFFQENGIKPGSKVDLTNVLD